jgi:hypothetical protein
MIRPQNKGNTILFAFKTTRFNTQTAIAPATNSPAGSHPTLAGPVSHFSQLSPAMAQKVQIAAQQQHQAQFAQQMHVLQRMQNDAQTAAAYAALQTAKMHHTHNAMSNMSSQVH